MLNIFRNPVFRTPALFRVSRGVSSLHGINGDPMFNRIKEMNCLMNVLASSPQLSIITGPVNSGKTRLIERLLLDLPSKVNYPTPVHSVNLRKGTFYSVDSLVNSLSVSISSWLQQVLNSVQSVSLSAGVVSLSLYSSSGQTASPIDRLNSLLEYVANCMPPRTLLRDRQLPVFVIDEANRLRALLRDPDGQAALESLFEWFILHTKEKQHFHVVLLSSDSFFNLWVEKFVGASRYSMYVLGHLEKSEAEQYWKAKLSENKWHNTKLAPPKFEYAYEVCGGSMYLMDLFMREYCEYPDGLINNNNKSFSIVLQEERRLIAALAPTNSFEELDEPKWKRDQLIKLMAMITNKGIVPYSDVCAAFGKSVIDSLIDYNIVHLRPSSRMSFDVPRHELPMITAESPAAVVAMKKVVCGYY